MESSGVKGINPLFCTHNTLMEDNHKPSALPLLERSSADGGYQTFGCWNYLPHLWQRLGKLCTSGTKQRGNDGGDWWDNELIFISRVSGWWVCVNYRKLNDATSKEHFKRLAGHSYYCFLDGFSGHFSDTHCPRNLRENRIHMSIWNICILSQAVWVM